MGYLGLVVQAPLCESTLAIPNARCLPRFKLLSVPLVGNTMNMRKMGGHERCNLTDGPQCRGSARVTHARRGRKVVSGERTKLRASWYAERRAR